MGIGIQVFLEIDDNSGVQDPPFASDGAIWDLQSDTRLSSCKDYKFIAAISGVRGGDEKPPLIPLRGLPPHDLNDPTKTLEGEPFVGWLTYPEVLASLSHHELQSTDLAKSVQALLDVMKALTLHWGQDRVRMIFAVCD